MPWREVTVIEHREEFVHLAGQESANVSELCRRFGISRKTGYKWLLRSKNAGPEGLKDQSSRPRQSPTKTLPDVEAKVLRVREHHPAWGARKIAHVLRRDEDVALASSTVNSILKRHGRIARAASQAATAWQRFEHAEPNDLLQMDFKGHFATGEGRCHPLTLLDDCSRYNLTLQAMGHERLEPVQACLQRVFERYGLPRRINADNGPPWGAGGQEVVTRLGLWLIRLGVRLSHSRPLHPQTNGKDERFHRTMKAEVLNNRHFRDFGEAQRHFDAWRRIYNHQRPHEALGMLTPAQRYRGSPRAMPSTLPEIEYGPGDLVRKVQAGGWISLHGKDYRVPKALRGLPVALRDSSEESDALDVFFCHQKVYCLDLAAP